MSRSSNVRRGSPSRRVQARHVSHPQADTTGECPRKGTIGKFSDAVLLNIFRYYLDAYPRSWPWLVHICRKWRRIVFASQRALHLRLFCTQGTPVLKTLDCWPALPIVVEYGGSLALDPPAPEDEDNIVAALKRSDRVSSIHLTITKALLGKLSSIEEPFWKLEDLVLLSLGDVQLTLPSTFRWGPHLRTLHSTGITFPALPQLLYSSRDLVDIQLHNIVSVGNLSPEALANALSRLAQLRSLSLHLRSSASQPDIGSLPSSAGGKRVVFPSLTRLRFRGTSGFFNRFIVRIDPPLLGDIEITFSGRLFLVTKLREFIDRIEMQKLHRRAEVLFSEHAISISFIQPGAPMPPKLRISIKPSITRPSNWHLFSMFELCNRLAAFLSGVEDLHIHATRLSSGQDNMDCENWAKLIHLFRGTKRFHIAGDLSTDIMLSLELYRMPREPLLPSLHKLCIREPGPRSVPLREAVVSSMVSRRLSGRPIDVEYERRAPHVMAEMLPDDVLLNIFRHCLHASPRSWPQLAHVCQGWRQVILNSPLGLDLRLYCTYGTPVLETLEYWPPLPLVVNYGGSPMLDPPAPEDEENIVVALKQSDRVGSISLTVTNSLLGRLPAISEPFLELEELVLLSQDNVQLTLPGTFRWGPRLRTLYSTRIAIPALPRLLSPSTGLVDLQLHEIPNVGYFSPDAFANALSEMTQLETLLLHFLSLPSRRNYVGLSPQSGGRVVLPALTCLQYRGTSKYLDSFVARIDAPRLRNIDITFFSQPTMDASQLGRFIERIEMQTPLSKAEVQTSAQAVSISFTNSSGSTPLRLQISCKQLDWQLSSMAQVCDQFSPFLHRVEDLGIDTTQSSSAQNDADGEQWVELVRSFNGAKDVRVAGAHVTNILCALRPADGGHTTLTSLCKLHLQNPMPIDGSFWGAAQSLITSRRLFGHPVKMQVLCHICNARFTEERERFKGHLRDKHAYRTVCSYCGVFGWWPGWNSSFREHLEKKHPEVARNDPLIANSSTPFLSFQLDRLVNDHTSLRAPDIVAPSTTVTAPHSDT